MSLPSSGQNGHTYASSESKKIEPAPKSNFLWWCAGVLQKLLCQYPSEYTKYAGIGGVIFATFVLAALSSGYAIYSVFGNIYWTFLFAFIWGLIIFNFDRFLVSTMRKYGVSFKNQVLLALPRFALALLIGLTIARPLELKIFEKEIDVKIEENRHKKILLNDSLLQEENKHLLQTATADRQRMAGRKAALEDTLHMLRQNYVQEADGTGGSGKRGIEKLTRLKMDAYENTLQQYSPELSKLGQQINYQDSLLSNLQSSTALKRGQYEKELHNKVGFLERNKALSDLSAEESSVFWANFFVSLLIILIEIGPILSKLITSVGPYDIALAKMELVQMAESENEMQKEKDLLSGKLQHLYRQKKEVSDGLVQQVTALQREHIQKTLKDWENGEEPAPNLKPLNHVMKTIKEKFGYEEENVI